MVQDPQKLHVQQDKNSTRDVKEIVYEDEEMWISELMLHLKMKYCFSNFGH
jgi:hypothetical protein